MLIWLQRGQYFAAPWWLTTGLSGNSPGAVWGIVSGLSGDCLGDVRGHKQPILRREVEGGWMEGWGGT